MPDELAKYLSRLEFDSSLWNSIHAKFITNFRLVLLLILAIVIIGIVNFVSIPHRLNPEVKIPIVTISTVLPGGTPGDIEALVTIPLEDKLKALENVDTMTSTSRDNVSVIVIQFLSSVDTNDARDKVQQAVDTVTDLPEDAKSPSVNTIDFENQPVWTFTLLSRDVPSLMKAADQLKDDLEDLPKVDHVDQSGNESQQIFVTVDPLKANEYSISPITLSQAVSQAAASFPAGSINANGLGFSLVIDPAIQTIDDIRNIRIKSNDKVVTLDEVATIQEASELDRNKTFYASQSIEPLRAVQFFVFKTKSANIDETAKSAEEKVNEFMKQYGETFKLETVMNTGELIDDQFKDLLSEFQTTVLLIFLILLVFLGLRQAIIASFTVPLTFLSAIAIANMLGLTLNFLTLFAFLIALGLLIDDTIVVVTAMTRYYDTGKFTPQEAGILVWRDFIVPIWSTTIATLWSFVPLLLAGGIIGEFIKPIPIIITATMVSSTSIAVLITIPLMIVFLKFNPPRRVRILLQILALILLAVFIFFIVPKTMVMIPTILIIIAIAATLFFNRKIYTNSIASASQKPTIAPWYKKASYIVSHGLINVEGMSNRYMAILHSILRSRSARRGVLGFLVVFALISYLLVPFGLVKNEFFPKTDEDTIYIGVQLPSGTNLKTTTAETVHILSDLRKFKDATSIVAETGTSIDANGDRGQDPSLILLTINLGDHKKRNKTSIEIASELRDFFKDYTKGKVTVQEISGGPPAGADLQIKLLGDNLSVLDEYSEKIMAFLRKQPGVTNVDKSIKSGTSKIVFIPDDNKLAAEGIDRGTLSLWLRTYASGFTLDSIRFDKEQDINFRLSSNKKTPEEISELYIQTPDGNIPLISLGEFRLDNNPTLIVHEDTKRTISVAATVTKGQSIADVNKKLETYANSLNLPRGYSWKTGGVNDENQKSVNSIMQAMGLSFLLILVTMVLEFNSYRQAAIVMLTIPLAVSGVFYVFGLTGTPLSFPALIGVLALFGIVVTNAIVVVEKINSNRREGMELEESIVDAAGSRLEPVLLTSLATIFGLLPITVSDPLWRGLGGAIIAGLLFSGTIKLIFIPVMYYNWFKDES